MRIDIAVTKEVRHDPRGSTYILHATVTGDGLHERLHEAHYITEHEFRLAHMPPSALAQDTWRRLYEVRFAFEELNDASPSFREAVAKAVKAQTARKQSGPL